jgi:hypothetical protein
MATMKGKIKSSINSTARKARTATDKASAAAKRGAKKVGAKVKSADQKIKQQGR